ADAGEFGERDGENREIDASYAEAKGEKSNERATGHCDHDRGSKPDPRRYSEMDIEGGGGIAAEPDIDRMTERELAGKAHHHVPGQAGIGEIKDDDENR